MIAEGRNESRSELKHRDRVSLRPQQESRADLLASLSAVGYDSVALVNLHHGEPSRTSSGVSLEGLPYSGVGKVSRRFHKSGEAC